MTVRKGEPWGEAGTMPSATPVFDTDATASRAVQSARSRGESLEIGLTGGDLWRTLGAPVGGEDRLRRGRPTRVQVDLGWVDLGRYGGHCFIAHCIARTRSWSRFSAVMNAEWLGRWDVAPRSHPGDGRFDIFEGALGLQARYSVRARLPTGSHLPHPEIHTRKASETSIELPRTLRLRLDGAPFPRISAFSVWLEPGSLTVYV